MNNKVRGYRVVIISPDNYSHSACFREVAFLLVSSLKSNNIFCDFAINDLSEEKINIILGYHLLKKNVIENEIINRNKIYIPFQMEQLTSKEFVFSEDIRFALENGITVWDYSRKNIAFLKENNINSKYLALGYHKNLELIKTIPEEQKDIDILFYGTYKSRRKKILDILSEKYKTQVLFGVYGKERDEFIKRAKIVLNIHHYTTQLLEVVRLSYLINNKIFVISEDAGVNPYKNLGIEFSKYNEIVSKCEFYLKNSDLRKAKRYKNYIAFKKEFQMEKFIAQII